MDPLSLLREFCISRQLDKVDINNDRVLFGDKYTFMRTMPTTYKSQLGKSDFYTLETVLFFIKSFHGGKAPPTFPEYMAQARSKGLPYVSRIDMKELESFLTGASATSNYIHVAVPELVLPQTHEAPNLGGEERPAKRTKPGGDVEDAGTAAGEDRVAAHLKEVQAHERVLRDRNSQLLVPSKNFRRALDLYRITSNADRAKAAKTPEQPRAPPPAKAFVKPLPVIPSRRYDRPTADTTDGAGPDTMQSYGVAPAVRKPEAHEPSSKHARPPSHKPAAPPPGRPGPPAPSASQHWSSAESHGHQQHRSHGSGRVSSREGPPIIVVPSAMTARINMFNAKEFLEQGTYKTPEECQKAGIKKQSFNVFERRLGRDKPVLYHLTDKAPPKGHKDWKRVVAIFTTGQLWQFKDYPTDIFRGLDKGDTVELFAKVMGAYLMYEDETADANVLKWNVKRYKLQRSTRHRDLALVKDIFHDLDEFLSKRRSHLKY